MTSHTIYTETHVHTYTIHIETHIHTERHKHTHNITYEHIDTCTYTHYTYRDTYTLYISHTNT